MKQIGLFLRYSALLWGRYFSRRVAALVLLQATALILHAQTAGSLDTAFNPGASTDQPARSIAVQADRQILLGSGFTLVNGQQRTNIARLNGDGTLESTSTFNPGSAANPFVVHCLSLQSDGRILIGGYFFTARLNADGTIDTRFNPGATPANDGFNFVDCLAVQVDGNILIGGRFSGVNGQPRNGIARLNPNGAVESPATFNAGTGISGSNSWAHSLALQADGKILIGGEFTSVNGQPRKNIARLNADGSVESTATFNPGTGVTGIIYCVAVQADGKILIGGKFSNLNGQPRNNIARLNPDGTVESTATFNPGTGANSDVYSIGVQADGKILIGGDFTSVNGQPRNRVARLFADGALESAPAFDSPGINGLVYCVVVQEDGKILLSGDFTSVNGQPRNRIARLANDLAVQTLTVPDSSRVRWMRGGAAPEVEQVSFELSTNDGASWISLGPGTRITGGWELTSLNLPASGSVRARGRTTGGFQNGSSGRVESVTQFSFGAVPEIAVEQPPGTFIPDGGSRDFGILLTGSNASMTFTVRNVGNISLTGLTITKDGADAEVFAVTASPTAPVDSGGRTTFTVQFAPASTGMKTAALHIASNDADESPFDIILTGTGVIPPAPIATTEAATSVSSRAATLHGAVNANGANTAVSFDYGLTPSYGSNVPGTPTPVTGGSATAVSANLTGLTPNTTYHYRVLGANSHGTAEGSDLTFTTLDDVPSFPAPGTPDITFGNNGVVPGSFTSVAVQSNGKIIAAGGSSIARFSENGIPDTSFGGSGIINTGMPLSSYDRSVAVHGDGKVVVVGVRDGKVTE